MKRIPINKPSISTKEIEYVNDAITNGWGEKCYEYITKFEKLFKKYIGSKYSLATSSCTGAIHLALMAMGIKEGDEVIVPEITWIATAEPVLYIGAKPVFVDVFEDTWCLDPQKVVEAITPKTKAIICVHLYGNLCDMDAIMKIANEYNLVVLEDAAESIGSIYSGKKAGSIANAGVFSFHGTKTISTGEGGMLVTNDIEVYEAAKILNDHGRNVKDPENKMFWMRNYGYKYKMSNLQAAMGCAQIERIDDLISRKREIFFRYKSNLIGLPCSFNPEYEWTTNSYWLPTLIFKPEINFNRSDFFTFCKKNNIDCRPFFFPLSSLPMFEFVKENKVAYEIYEHGINLPSYHELTDSDIDFVSNSIKQFLKI